MEKMTCKDCLYYSGIQCHGHGEFWGECNIFSHIYNFLEDYHKYYLDSDLDPWICVCYDDTICKFYELLRNKNYEKK